MAKKEYDIEDWKKFRNEILELVMLYMQIKEYSEFDKNKIKYIESFFYLSQQNAIASFFIKVGFVMNNGTPSLRNFLSDNDIQELLSIYQPKIQLIRDKRYAHNNKSAIEYLKISDGEVDELFTKIISMCRKIDSKYEEAYLYKWIGNLEGIKSIEHIIDASNELYELKERILANNFEATIKMDIQSGELQMSE